MRRLFFAGDNADFNFFEMRLFQPAMQVAFLETEPLITVQLGSFVKAMLQQIKYQDLPAWPQNLIRALQRFGWVFCVMQRLA